MVDFLARKKDVEKRMLKIGEKKQRFITLCYVRCINIENQRVLVDDIEIRKYMQLQREYHI